ncbi:hypothetical protein GAY31_20055 [Azospirillum brasilense]|nr:hypothetical protein [Azospirillum brasilense]
MKIVEVYNLASDEPRTHLTVTEHIFSHLQDKRARALRHSVGLLSLESDIWQVVLAETSLDELEEIEDSFLESHCGYYEFNGNALVWLTDLDDVLRLKLLAGGA